jgi:hypothetical protein
MAILIEPPNNWDNLQGKPAILNDSQINWNEITDIPIDISNFLSKAVTPPNKYTDYLLGVYQNSQGITYKWHLLNSSASSYSVAWRDPSGNLKANNFVAAAIPTSPTGLSIGSFWRDIDAGNIVKIV